MVAGTYLMSAFMSAHSSLLFTLHQLQQQQLMQCLPATILLSLSLSLSLSHCCLLSLIVPPLLFHALPCSKQQELLITSCLCFCLVFICDICFSFLFCVCVCVFFFWFFFCVLSFSLPGEEFCCCVLWLERSLQREEWHEWTREESLRSLWWWLVLRLSSCCVWLSSKGFCSLELLFLFFSGCFENGEQTSPFSPALFPFVAGAWFMWELDEGVRTCRVSNLGKQGIQLNFCLGSRDREREA